MRRYGTIAKSISWQAPDGDIKFYDTNHVLDWPILDIGDYFKSRDALKTNIALQKTSGESVLSDDQFLILKRNPPFLQDAETLCDRVAILERGRLRWCGELKGLISGDVRWFEVSIQGAAPSSLPGERVSAVGEQTLLRVADVAELTALLSQARQSGLQVLSIWPRRDTLEDLFLRELGADRSARSA